MGFTLMATEEEEEEEADDGALDKQTNPAKRPD
jgi:hypothetical protein